MQAFGTDVVIAGTSGVLVRAPIWNGAGSTVPTGAPGYMGVASFVP